MGIACHYAEPQEFSAQSHANIGGDHEFHRKNLGGTSYRVLERKNDHEIGRLVVLNLIGRQGVSLTGSRKSRQTLI